MHRDVQFHCIYPHTHTRYHMCLLLCTSAGRAMVLQMIKRKKYKEILETVSMYIDLLSRECWVV